jgi:DDE superfamily endonuclease
LLTLPAELLPLIVEFAPLFTKRVWEHAKVLLIGAILAPGKRTVTSCLRVMGLSDEKRFERYHRVLNRARWSAFEASRILLRLLVSAFAPTGEIIIGIDDTIERRWGARINARGIYRDPVRSSKSHFVKTSGLRWLCCMMLVTIPWAGAVWGLPFLTVLAPSERYYAEERGRGHQRLTDRAWQAIHLIMRWLPKRTVIFVADSSFAVLELLYLVSTTPGASLVTRLRLDAQLWDPAPPRKKGQKGRPRVKGKRKPSLQKMLKSRRTKWIGVKLDWYGEKNREIEIYSETAVWYNPGNVPVPIRWVLIRDPQGEFESQALLSTNLNHTPQQIVEIFIRRWKVEVTFEESRAHLGIETQRQWADAAIARTTPILFGLFSLITLMATKLINGKAMPVRTAAWYEKESPSFSDAIALVRCCLWSSCHFSMSGRNIDLAKIPRSLLDRFIDTLCYAA